MKNNIKFQHVVVSSIISRLFSILFSAEREEEEESIIDLKNEI